MPETWPATVPYRPNSNSQSVEPFRAPFRTEMEDGNQVSRRRSTKNIATLAFTIRMTNDEFDTFKAWVRDDLVDGVLSFTMSIFTGSAYASRTCTFREPYKYDPGSGLDAAEVSLSLDVEDY